MAMEAEVGDAGQGGQGGLTATSSWKRQGRILPWPPENKHEKINVCCYKPPSFRSFLQQPQETNTAAYWTNGGHRMAQAGQRKSQRRGFCRGHWPRSPPFLPASPALQTLCLTQDHFCSPSKEPMPGFLWASTQLHHLSLQMASCRPPSSPP